MKRSSTQRGMERLSRKTFAAALSAELRKQVPSLGQMLADKLSEHLEKLFHQYFPPAERLRMGQMVWPAVAKDETGAYGKRLQDTKLTPVILNVLTDKDILDFFHGADRWRIRQRTAVRLFDEAYEQDGVLTEVDVAAIMGLTDNTISTYVTDFEKTSKRVVPRRGTVHDMGPSVTHKGQICYRVLVLGQSIEQTARETNHSPESVTRYVQDYRRITHCLANSFSITETAFATKLSERLVREYADLQEELIQKPTNHPGPETLQ
jgi:hypothetical protein